MFEFRRVGHHQMAQIIKRSTHALVVAASGNTTFNVCRTLPLLTGTPSCRNIYLRDSGACVKCPHCNSVQKTAVRLSRQTSKYSGQRQ